MTDGNNPYAPPPPSGERPQNPTYNPYAPPEARLGTGGGDVDDAEAVRREHLKHEASIKAMGCLYQWNGIVAFGGAGVILLLGILTLFESSAGGMTDTLLAFGLFAGIAVVYGLFAYFAYWAGKGLRNLEAKVRVAITILAVISLIGFPIGTLLGLYILYLVHSEKGKRILTQEYRRVVALTPHIKYRTPVWVWIAIALIVGLVIFVLVAEMA